MLVSPTDLQCEERRVADEQVDEGQQRHFRQVVAIGSHDAQHLVETIMVPPRGKQAAMDTTNRKVPESGVISELTRELRASTHLCSRRSCTDLAMFAGSGQVQVLSAPVKA